MRKGVIRSWKNKKTKKQKKLVFSFLHINKKKLKYFSQYTYNYKFKNHIY